VLHTSLRGAPSPKDSGTGWVLRSLKKTWQTYGACSHRYTFLLLISTLSSSFVVDVWENIYMMLPSAHSLHAMINYLWGVMRTPKYVVLVVNIDMMFPSAHSLHAMINYSWGGVSRERGNMSLCIDVPPPQKKKPLTFLNFWLIVFLEWKNTYLCSGKATISSTCRSTHGSQVSVRL
jgi:hypothetical protein